MDTYTEHTLYGGSVIVDINPLKLQKYKRPLVIVARDGQKIRLLKWASEDARYLEEGGFKLEVLGWWELEKSSYLLSDGINRPLFKKHDVVFFMDPNRVFLPARDSFNILIQLVSSL